jgi:glucose/mannose-6-phosphate isomerase
LHDPFSAERIEEIDTHSVRGAYASWPELARQGYRVRDQIQRGEFKRALFLAMGGSAAGADLISGWCSFKHGFTLEVWKGKVPHGELKGTLAVACSSSGETLETIDMMRTAARRGATVIAMSAGGPLEEESEKLGVQHLRLPVTLAPRYLLPYITFSCLAILERAASFSPGAATEESFAQMAEEWAMSRPETGRGTNEAKEIASDLMTRTPIVYGARLAAGVGVRFKNALHENSKRHASFYEIPDAFHNEVESWQDPDKSFVPVFLRHTSETDFERVRADVMEQMLRSTGKKPIVVRGRGGSDLAQLVTMSFRLDLASYYLAIGLGRDPYPTLLLDRLKKKASSTLSRRAGRVPS